MNTCITPIAVLVLAAAFAACGESDVSSLETDAPAVYCPKDDSGGIGANELVGLDLNAAKQAAKESRCTLRVVKEDGESPAITDDLSTKRINVVVAEGTVTRIDGIY